MVDQLDTKRVVWGGRTGEEKGNLVNIYGERPLQLPAKETERMYHRFFRVLRRLKLVKQEDPKIIRARETAERKDLQVRLDQATKERDLLAEQVKTLRARETVWLLEQTRLWDMINVRVHVLDIMKDK